MNYDSNKGEREREREREMRTYDADDEEGGVHGS
jgi:hypothetical protein